MSVSLPPKWCGVEHPHDMHQWVEPSGQTGFYRYCPGSTGPASCQHDGLAHCPARTPDCECPTTPAVTGDDGNTEPVFSPPDLTEGTCPTTPADPVSLSKGHSDTTSAEPTTGPANDMPGGARQARDTSPGKGVS